MNGFKASLNKHFKLLVPINLQHEENFKQDTIKVIENESTTPSKKQMHPYRGCSPQFLYDVPSSVPVLFVSKKDKDAQKRSEWFVHEVIQTVYHVVSAQSSNILTLLGRWATVPFCATCYIKYDS